MLTTTGPIERIVLVHLRVPLKEPFQISRGEVAIKDAILVALETTSAEGLGESSPMAAGFGYSDDTPEGCWDDLVKTIGPSLLGRSIQSIEDIDDLASSWPSASRFAVAGAETALWDLLGQARHASIAELLGASELRIEQGAQSGLAVGLCSSTVHLLKTIEAHLEAGYQRVKIKIQPGRDIELVHAVRQHLGEIDLMVDANASYTAADIDVFRQLDEYDLLMFEQPFAADDLDGLAELQRSVVTPVCLDETADTLERAQRALDRGAGQIVNIKLQRVGGFGPALRMHDLCHRAGAACWVGCMPELGIGQAHGLHLAALANCTYPTDIEPSARWFVDDYTVPTIEMSAPGTISVPTRPGLGYRADPAKVRRFQVRRHEIAARTMG